MLMLGAGKRTVSWPAAGMTLDLAPLTEDVDAQLVEATVTEERDERGRLVRLRRDAMRYAELVGRHCITGWTGAVDERGQPVECTPENIDRFMRIPEAQAWVFGQVKSLRMHLLEETAAAGNA